MSKAVRSDPRPDQLPLDIALSSRSSFANFVPGPNVETLAILRHQLKASPGGVVYLWGGSGTGKSHLLEACCGDAAARSGRVAYAPLAAEQLEPGMLTGLGGLQLVCVDDVDAVAGDLAWEKALFSLYNECDRSACALLFAAGRPPISVPWRLPDLASRLGAGVVCRLRELGDQERRDALKLRARERGFDFPDEVATFVLNRERRDMMSLFELLDRLDRSSLAAKRRITVPFVKAMLEGSDE